MKYLLLLTAFFMSVVAWGQSVSSATMILSGPGGSAVGMVSSSETLGSGSNGSFSSSVLDIHVLPTEVATALESADIEDIAITVSNGKINVSAEGYFECNVYDVSGRIVAMQRSSVPVGFNVASGLYIVAVSREGKVVCARKTLVK